MKKILTAALMILLLLNFRAHAQDSVQTVASAPIAGKPYKTAIGLQLTGIGTAFANPKGLSIKHFISSRSALEFNITPGGRNIISSNLVFQKHFWVYDAPNLQWYAGAGANLDLYRYRPYSTTPETSKAIVASTNTLIGIIGAEYKLPNLPFTISGDIKKGFFGYSSRGVDKHYNRVHGLRPTISFRYTFGQ